MAGIDWAKRAVISTCRRLPPGVVRSVPGDAARVRLLNLYTEVLRVHPVSFDRADSRFGFALAGTTADLLQRNVYVFGMWEPNISRWVRTHLRPGDVVVDIGANVGYFSMLCAVCTGPSGQVIAFEPVPSIVAALRANLELNGMASVRVEPVVASDEPGTTEIWRAAAGNLGMSSTTRSDGMVSEGVVSKVRAADAIEPELWSSIRLVKVDTEGDDLRALRGMQPALREMPAGGAVLVEITPEDLRARGQTPDDVVAFMRDNGFDRMMAVANSYEWEAYARDRPEQPTPLQHPPHEKTDVIFLKSAPT